MAPVSQKNLKLVRDCATGVLSNLLIHGEYHKEVLGEDGIPLLMYRLHSADSTCYERETILEIFLDLVLGVCM